MYAVFEFECFFLNISVLANTDHSPWARLLGGVEDVANSGGVEAKGKVHGVVEEDGGEDEGVEEEVKANTTITRAEVVLMVMPLMVAEVTISINTIKPFVFFKYVYNKMLQVESKTTL